MGKTVEDSHHDAVNNKLTQDVELAEPVRVLPGWCRNWKHQNTGESERMTGQRTYFTGENVTQASCIARCNEHAGCHQAVFEASGPWGPQCWGHQASTARPTDSRPCSGHSTPCVDFCYNKEGWARIASDPDHLEAGWCRDWSHQNTGESMRMRGQRTFFGGADVTQRSCIDRCNEDMNCAQAVFEASGPWGPQCWLGHQESDARPRYSRGCKGHSSGVPCVDFCYNKAGWAPRLGPVHVVPGWCRNCKHQNTGESERMTGQKTYFTGASVTQASCIDRCNENVNCAQAVFEASGPWGPQCWLGHKASNLRPKSSRPCSKHPNTGESMRMTGQQTYFTGASVTQASCIQKCNEAGDACHQAVFEASGPWGPQCWLGTQKSTVRPTGSRPCTGKSVPCVDYCYNKEGWARIASDPDNLLAGWCRNCKHQN